MLEAPVRGGRIRAVLDLHCVTERAEHARANARLHGLPFPEIVAERARDVVEVLHRAHAEELLNLVLLVGRAKCGDGIDVFGDRLHVRGTLLGHLMHDWGEISVEVLNSLYTEHESTAINEKYTNNLRTIPLLLHPAQEVSTCDMAQLTKAPEHEPPTRIHGTLSGWTWSPPRKGSLTFLANQSRSAMAEEKVSIDRTAGSSRSDIDRR
jgi:hypothetical protein